MSQPALKIVPNHSETPVEVTSAHPLRRKPPLDGIRGVSAVWVMCFHYFYTLALPAPLLLLAKYGWTGVELFFVLSGYLIATILHHHQKSPTLFSSFYGRRSSRIMPLFYASIALCYVINEWMLRAPNPVTVPYWSYFLFVNDIFISHTDTMGTIAVAWSLAIEEKFYLVSPFLFRFFSFRTRFIILIGVLSWSVARQAWLSYYSHLSFLSEGKALQNSAWLRWEGICLGMLAAMITVKYGESFWRLPRVRKLNLLLFVVVLSSMFLPWPPSDSPWFHAVTAIQYLRISLIYCSVLTLVLGWEGTKATNWLGSRPFVWLGSISYGVYILHIPIMQISAALTRRLGLPEGLTKELFSKSVGVATTLLVAHLSWKFFEKRFVDAAHRRFRY